MIGIIPAAGKGVRFKELGKQYPKAILPYNNRPILVSNIENMLQVCDKIRIVVGHQKEKIIETVNRFFPNDRRISFITQHGFLGLSAAVLEAIKPEDDDQLLIVLGDLLLDTPLNSLDSFDNSFVSVKLVNDYSRWCMAEADNTGQILNFYDKPDNQPPTNYAVSGVYFFKSSRKVKSLIETQMEKSIKIKNEYQISYVMENTEDFFVNSQIDIIDFGTLEEYLQNKNVPISRTFNNIHINGNIVRKSSKNREKMLQEYLWFNNLPKEMKIFTPHTLSSSMYENDIGSYELEKIFSPTLREIFLFLDYSTETWEGIIDSLFQFVKLERSFTSSSSDFFEVDLQKVKRRIKKVPFESSIVKEFISVYEDVIASSLGKEENTIMHGDLCFSNTFFDIPNRRLKVIDPKGPIFGSYKYDLAKIFHSIIYPYDFIDADLYSLDNNDDHIYYDSGREPLRKMFLEKFAEEFGEEMIHDVKIITAALFLSMIPLHSHSHEHQKLFFNTFLEICKELNIG